MVLITSTRDGDRSALAAARVRTRLTEEVLTSLSFELFRVDEESELMSSVDRMWLKIFVKYKMIKKSVSNLGKKLSVTVLPSLMSTSLKKRST